MNFFSHGGVGGNGKIVECDGNHEWIMASGAICGMICVKCSIHKEVYENQLRELFNSHS